MPCGEACKILLDQHAALVHSLECMKNSILLNAANGGSGPPASLRRQLAQSMNDLAALAQEVVRQTPADGGEVNP